MGGDVVGVANGSETDRKDTLMPLALELYKIPNNSRPSQPDSAPAVWPHSVHTIATGSHHMNEGGEGKASTW